jgi:peptide/nickel transport system substrate-binding protein
MAHTRRSISRDSAVTRRRFLGLLGLGAGVSLLGACAPAAPSAPGKPAEGASQDPYSPAPQAAAPAAPAAPAAQPAAAPASQPTTAPAAIKPSGSSRRVTLAYGTEIPSFSPYAQSGGTGYTTWMNIYEPLMRLDLNGDDAKLLPVLAERWETPDAKTWTFYLRKGLTFTDGSPFTVEDAIFSYNRIMNDPDSLQADQLKTWLVSMEALDSHTLKMELNRPNSTWLDELRNKGIMSKTHFEKMGSDKEKADRQPVGTGPFLFKEWVQGQRFVLTKNANYWGTKVEPDEVVIRYIPEEVARLTALNNGEIDVLAALPPYLIPQLNASRARALSVTSERAMLMPMRPDMAPTDNKLVRQAISHAIDRKSIVENVLEGYAVPLNGPLQTFCLGYDPGAPEYYPFNPAKSRELLAQAGVSDLSVEFTVGTSQYIKAREIGQVIVSMLKDVGINADMKTPETATFNAGVGAGKFGFYFTGRGNTRDPSPGLTQFFRTGASKRVGYSNPEFDKLMDAQQSITSEQERGKLISQAVRLLMEDAPAVFLFNYKDAYGVANHIDFQPWSNEYVHAFLFKFKG